jgi:hypothetical protein
MALEDAGDVPGVVGLLVAVEDAALTGDAPVRIRRACADVARERLLERLAEERFVVHFQLDAR